MIYKILLVPLMTLLFFSGCTTLSQNEAFESLNDLAHSRGVSSLRWIQTPQDAAFIQESVGTLLSKPLTQESALRIALLNNRGLQQMYAEVGIAHSELVEAGLMRNPLLGYSFGSGGGGTTATLSLEVAFLDLLWIPLRRELGGIALQEATLRVGDAVLKHARDVKKSYIDAYVAQIKIAMNASILKSHEASLQLAIRQYTAGNTSKREMLKIQDAYQHAHVESIRLARENASTREALNTLLGLYADETHYTLSTEPLQRPQDSHAESELEVLAISNRLDMKSAIKSVEYAAAQAGLSQTTRFLDAVELSVETEQSSKEEQFNTFGIKLAVPIFDFGQGRVSAAQARYNQSLHRLYETAVNIRSQVRQGYAHYRYSYDIANEYDAVIVKTNQQILEETQLFYNAMLDGIYELLEDQRRASESRIEALEALGELYKAQADLEYIIGG